MLRERRTFDVGSDPVRIAADSERLDTLTRVFSDQLLDAFGMAQSWPGRSFMEWVPRIPARRLARQVMEYDRIVGESGLGAGGMWALKRMARRSEVESEERVPREGPLLVVANHPGLADAVSLFAVIPRADLRAVAARRTLLDALPNTSRHLIPVSEDAPGRLGPVRAVSNHLKAGGAVLTFPGGRIEPDPAVSPGAADYLEEWSRSVDLFARLVPELIVVPAMVSGVLSRTAMRNPLIHARRRKRDQEWLAACIQMLVPALRDMTTRVTFGKLIFASDFVSGEALLSRAVVDEMRHLILRHELGR